MSLSSLHDELHEATRHEYVLLKHLPCPVKNLRVISISCHYSNLEMKNYDTVISTPVMVVGAMDADDR